MTHRPETDAEAAARELLCLRCRRGDRAAWDELVRTWERPLYYYLRRMTRSEDEALGVLQDAWVQVFSSLPRLTDPSRLAAWLYTIARRAFLQQLTRRSSAPPRAEQAPETNDDTSALDDSPSGRESTAFSEFENAEAVHWGLEQLVEREREVLVLFFLQDLSLREMASVLDIPIGTVKSRLSKARSDLRTILERTETSS